MGKRRTSKIAESLSNGDINHKTVMTAFLDGYRWDDPTSLGVCVSALREFVDFGRERIKESGHESPAMMNLSTNRIATMVKQGGKECNEWLDGVLIRVMNTNDSTSATAFRQLVQFMHEYARVYR